MVKFGARPPQAVSSDDAPGEAIAMMATAHAAAEGDLRATREILEAVAPRVGRIVRLILGAGHPDVDDVTQLSLIGFTQSLPAFRGECGPSHYASRIAVRTAVHARRRARERWALHNDLVDADDEIGGSTPHEEVLAERRKRLIRTLLGVIPAEQAETLALRVALGWSLEEIAAASATPINTVRSRLRLAKEALRRTIEEDPILNDELGVTP